MPIEIATAEPHMAERAAPAKFSLNMHIRLGSRTITPAERILFTGQLALLLETGVSLAEALKAICSQATDPLYASIVGSLAERVNEGQRFSDSLAQHPEMFSQTYYTLVAAAEEGGFLARVLEQLREMDEKHLQMRSNMIAALSYPAFLLAFSIVVVIFVLVAIFPQFSELFRSIHDQLPATTVLLMYLSELLRTRWLLILLIAGTGLGVLYTWGKTAAARRQLDRLKMRAPFIGGLFVQAYLQQALGVLGLSLANGMPISVALRASKGVIQNREFGALLEDVQRRIEEGQTVAAGFIAAGFIPPMVQQMISTGERSGNLGKVMSRLAEYYGGELNKRLATLSRMLEPLMLMVMGVLVGVVVASLILPIFKLSRAMH